MVEKQSDLTTSQKNNQDSTADVRQNLLSNEDFDGETTQNSTENKGFVGENIDATLNVDNTLNNDTTSQVNKDCHADTDCQECADCPTDTDKQEKKGVLAYLSKKAKGNRIWEIDFLRGLCVFLMIFDHAALMLAYYFGPVWYGWIGMETSAEFGAKLCQLCYTYWNSPLREIGHPIVLFVFFSISGISCSFSRSNLKRGIILAVVSATYTLVTYLLDKFMYLGCFTAFGVLHFYAVCILVWAIICIVVKNNKVAKTIISGILVILVAVLYFCYKAPETTPEWLFWIWPRKNFDGTPSLFYTQGEVSPGDLFTLIPYASFFFAGTFLQPLLYSKRRSLLPKLDKGWHRPITFLGRHALTVYILHVVLVAVVLCLVSITFFGTWGLF